MMNYIALMFLLTAPFIVGCSALCKEERYAHQIIDAFGRQQRQKNRLTVIGTGGSIPDKVRTINISFNSDKKLSIDDARLLYVGVVQDFIKMANEDGRLAPYAQNWPFNENNVEVTISFYEKGKRVPPPYVAFIFMVRGNICYNQFDFQTGRLVDYHKEPYAEAVSIVNGTTVK